MAKITVIVPVYNVEKYLKKCLDTLVNQTYKDLEIIIVNDGSTDNSKKIILDFLESHENIIYLEKENGGLSDARNYGLRRATGDYICFVDADDYLSTNLFSSLERYMHLDYDLIKYKMIKVDENYKETEKIEGPTFEEKNGEDAFNTLYVKDTMIQPAWLYLYKRKFLEENNFSYPVGKYHEDFARTILIMLKAKKVASSNVYGYYYYQSESSITRGNSEEKKLERIRDLIEHYDYMEKNIDSYNLSKTTIENVKIYYTNNILIKLEELNKKSKREIIKEIKKRKMQNNIKARNLKQLIKKIILNININWYLKLR